MHTFIEPNATNTKGLRLKETMMDDEIVTETLSRQNSGISCPICLGEAVSPRILPCGHIFCFHCVSYWVKSQRIKKSFKCPVCRMKVTIPKRGVTGFITPYFDLIPTTVDETSVSDLPMTSSSSQRLNTAENSFKMQPKISHVSAFEKCNNHPDEIKKWFCSDCQLAICQDCMIQSHHLHTCIPGMEKEKQSRIERCVQSLIHASQCDDTNCTNLKCNKLRRVMEHVNNCKLNCRICKQLKGLSYIHAKQCRNAECPVLFCFNIRHSMQQTRMPHLTDRTPGLLQTAHLGCYRQHTWAVTDSTPGLLNCDNASHVPAKKQAIRTMQLLDDSDNADMKHNSFTPVSMEQYTMLRDDKQQPKNYGQNIQHTEDNEDVRPLTPQDEHLIQFLASL